MASRVDRLPNEVLESIFPHIPLVDLIRSCSLVNHRWHDIISSSRGKEKSFLHYRKLYYRYTFKHEETITELEALVSAIQDPKDCIPWLLSHLHQQPDLHVNARLSIHKNNSLVLFSAVERHSRYPFALALLKERFPQLSSPVSFPAIVAVICFTARNVDDIREIFKLAVSASSPCVSAEITELVYQIGTFLLLFERKGWCPSRVHYLVYYALHLYLNDWCYDASTAFTPCTVSSLPQERVSVSLTAEQRRIIHHDVDSMLREPPATVKIAAYAGTGKTTTLVELCRANPRIKFLLVVFNRSVSDHSKAVFPSNVSVRTVNSLSWAYVHQMHTGHFQNYNLKYEDLIQYDFIKTGFPGYSLYHRAAMTVDTLNKFFNSDSLEITSEHAPEYWIVGRKEPSEKRIESNVRNMLADDAKHIWRKIRTKYNNKMKFDYNSSMKEFQLSNPNLQVWGGRHDVLLIDEAQDMNPACLDICLNQKTPKFVVGDCHQQIYSFRGAINALSVVDTHPKGNLKHTFFLTQSFRFGPEIAFVAQSCLTTLQRAKGPVLVGSKKKDSVTLVEKKPGVQKIAILARTNLRLFEEMVKLVCEVDEDKRPNIAFPMDTSANSDPIGFQLILDLEHFRAGNMHLISGKYIKYNSKKGWEKFKQSKQEGRDQETMAKIAIVERYKEKIPGYIDILEKQSRRYSFHHPDVNYIFSTVHKFKGLECSTVRLLDDFFLSPNLPYQIPRDQEDTDEFNLVYVALTRAKENLVLNDTLFYLMTSKMVNHNFETVEASSTYEGDTCSLCNKSLENVKAGYIQRQSVRVHKDQQRLGGSLCCLCSGMPFRFVNDEMSRRSVNLRTGCSMRIIRPGIIKDLYHLFLTPLVGPTKQELATGASSYYRELEVAFRDTGRVWEEVGILDVDDLSDPSRVENDGVKDFMEDDDSEFLKLMGEDMDNTELFDEEDDQLLLQISQSEPTDGGVVIDLTVD